MRQEIAENDIYQVHDKSLANSIKQAISRETLENKENDPNGEIVLENLMTRIIDQPKFTKTDNDKVQIQSLMKIKAFQNIVKSADQLFCSPIPAFQKPLSENEIFTPTPEPKPIDFTPTPETKPFATCESSEYLPCFGSGNSSKLYVTPEQGIKGLPPSCCDDDDELFSARTPESSGLVIESVRPCELVPTTCEFEDYSNEVDEYINDDDLGFEGFTCGKKDIEEMSCELAEKFDFPKRSCRPRNPNRPAWIPDGIASSPDGTPSPTSPLSDATNFIHLRPSKQQLPKTVKFPSNEDSFYPIELEGIVYDCYDLRVVYNREKTGFEDTKEFQIVMNSVIAGRFQVMEYLGSAAFSKAIQCKDLLTDQMVCLKIIENNKDYFDQSLDEIKLLRLINLNGDMDAKNCLKMHDCFYYKEHLIIVTELLRDNLYEFCRYNRENEDEIYFTVGRLQRVTYQILTALEYVHSLHLIHSDLKPENILMKSYSRCEIKVIDFGSSCFTHDHLSSYVQSRSYRSPEVILGCAYDSRIDIWSLGCIIPELFTGNVLFQNDTVQGLLARMIGTMGPFPDHMFKGVQAHNFFTKDKILYQEKKTSSRDAHLDSEMAEMLARRQKPKIELMVPKKTNLKARVRSDDALFLDFIANLLDVDYLRRPTAKEALRHPWLTEARYIDGLP